MEHTCSTCRYYDLPTDAFPCEDCKGCKSIFGIDNDHWAIRIEDLEDPSEKIDALFESISQISICIGKLQSTVNDLKEEIKQRR